MVVTSRRRGPAETCSSAASELARRSTCVRIQADARSSLIDTNLLPLSVTTDAIRGSLDALRAEQSRSAHALDVRVILVRVDSRWADDRAAWDLVQQLSAVARRGVDDTRAKGAASQEYAAARWLHDVVSDLYDDLRVRAVRAHRTGR
jgi:hypothetical protein